jgi:ELWxxDGT repeat protein
MIRSLRALSLSIVLLALPLAGADAPYLVTDLPGIVSRGSAPRFWTTVGNMTWFTADRGSVGQEVWKTDGTDAGTVRMTDVVGFNKGHAEGYFIGVVGHYLIYTGQDSQGEAVFSLDMNGGAPAVLFRMPYQPSASRGTLYKGRLYFAVPTDMRPPFIGVELCSTDGTPAGTTIADLDPGSGSSGPDTPVIAGDWMFFEARMRQGSGWLPTIVRSDGTVAGTTVVKALEDNFTTSRVVAIGANVVFEVFHRGGKTEMWATDGTVDGTVAILEGMERFRFLGTFAGKLLFYAEQVVENHRDDRLWITDGTRAGTVPLVDQSSGLDVYRFSEGAAIGGKYFFFVYGQPDALYAVEPAVGTLQHIADVDGGDYTNHSFVCNGTFFFHQSGSVEAGWWSSDGTAAGTRRVDDPWPNWVSGSLITRPEGLLFAANGWAGTEPWITDGTPAGTHMVKNIGIDNQRQGSLPRALNGTRDALFFVANGMDAPVVGRSDGTAAGTTTVDVSYSASAQLAPFHSGGVYYAPLGTGLMRSDGTAAGTYLLSKDATTAVPFHGGALFLTGAAQKSLWFTDGTIAGTRRIDVDGWSPDEDLIIATSHGSAWFASEYKLWKSDGTSAGTIEVAEPSQWDHRAIGAIVEGPQATYFVATGRLWRTDGTSAGTRLVKDDAEVAHDGPFAATADQLFFVGGTSLWRTDGTTENTIPLPASNSSNYCSRMAASGDSIYWYSTNRQYDATLWRSDGTSAGTTALATFPEPPPHAGSYDCNSMAFLNGEVYFSGWSAQTGWEPWVSDGTVAGTRLLQDVYPGPQGSLPMELTAAAGRIFFTAETANIGRELWAAGKGILPRRRSATH